MLTFFYLLFLRSDINKDTAIVIFFVDIVLLVGLCFSVGYFCSIATSLLFTAALLLVCLPAPFYFDHRKKIRLELLPPKGSSNKAYLDFQIAFDKRAPWRIYGDMFFDLFCPKSFVFFAIVTAIGKIVVYFVR